MSKADYVALLKTNLLLVTFRKTNGEIRHMKATQYQPYLDRVCTARDPAAVDKPRKENPNLVACWDLEANSWRSFMVESVLEYQLLPILMTEGS
jgi:hypothetical protein